MLVIVIIIVFIIAFVVERGRREEALPPSPKPSSFPGHIFLFSLIGPCVKQGPQGYLTVYPLSHPILYTDTIQAAPTPKAKGVSSSWGANGKRQGLSTHLALMMAEVQPQCHLLLESELVEPFLAQARGP